MPCLSDYTSRSGLVHYGSHRHGKETITEALVIARRDNFAWLTGGGESGVILNQENGFVYLMVTQKERAAVALRADAGKAEEELLKGLCFTFHTLDWKSAGIESYIGSLLEGEGHCPTSLLRAVRVTRRPYMRWNIQ